MDSLLKPAGRTAPGGLRSTLRSRTRAAHDRVDAAFSRFDLQTRGSYAAFLSAHAAVLPAVEAALTTGGAQALVPDWPDRLRTPALMGDLQRLGLGLPSTVAAPSLASEAQVLGALYVVEGSRLGARLLLGEARRSPDPSLREATAYLAHGEGRRFWPSFLQVLDAYGGDEGEVVEGARSTFDVFAGAVR